MEEIVDFLELPGCEFLRLVRTGRLFKLVE
jgi:hypothetical protein